MSWKRRVKIGIVVLAAVLAAAGMWFARPLTLKEISGLNPCECVSIQFFYDDSSSKEHSEEKIELFTGENGFSALLELLQEKEFSRSPFWWIPSGGKSHRWMEGDFRWNLYLIFKDAELPDGSLGSGAILHLNNFFEDLELWYDGRIYPVWTSDQKQWLEDVLACILETEAKLDSNQ